MPRKPFFRTLADPRLRVLEQAMMELAKDRQQVVVGTGPEILERFITLAEGAGVPPYHNVASLRRALQAYITLSQGGVQNMSSQGPVVMARTWYDRLTQEGTADEPSPDC